MPIPDRAFRLVGCPLCRSTSFDPLAVGGVYPHGDGTAAFLAARCRSCELVHLNPRPDDRTVNDSSEHKDSARRLEKIARRLAEKNPGLVFTESDPPPKPGTDLDGDEQPRRIYLAGLLERHPDPAGLLILARRHLDPAGEIVLLVSNADAGVMRWFGRRHASLYAFPARRQLFGVEPLRTLAQAAGLSVEGISSCSDPSVWSKSLRNLIRDWGGSRSRADRLPESLPGRLFAWCLEEVYRFRGRGAVLVARLRPVLDAERPIAQIQLHRPPAILGRSRPPVAILGAGVAGLTAARLLQHHGVETRVFEAGRNIAGLAQSFRDEEGFSHDFGAHFITNRFAAALGIASRCRTVHRFGEAVRLGGNTYGYPFGLMRHPLFLSSAIAGRLATREDPEPQSARDLFRRQFGPRLADDVALPLVEAWSGADAADLAPSVSPPQLDRGIAHVMKLKLASRLSQRAVANGFSRAQPENAHVFHVYPLDGVSVLTARLAEGLDDVIELESRVEAIHVDEGRVVAVRVAGTEREVSAVVSTAPVHVLPKLLRGSQALEPLARFRYRAFTLVNMRFDRRPVLSEVCTWIPDSAYTFFRLTEAPLAMPWLAPHGKTILTVDIGCEVGDRIWTMEGEELGELCISELEDLFPGARRAYLGCHVLRTPVAHPVYLREYEEDRRRFARGLPIDGLYSVGRNGEFAHILMEDVFWRTRLRVHEILEDLACGYGSGRNRLASVGTP